MDALVWLDKVAQHFSVRFRDHARVDVGTRPQIIEDTSSDSVSDKSDRFLTLNRRLTSAINPEKRREPVAYIHVWLPRLLEYCHGR